MQFELTKSRYFLYLFTVLIMTITTAIVICGLDLRIKIIILCLVFYLVFKKYYYNKNSGILTAATVLSYDLNRWRLSYNGTKVVGHLRVFHYSSFMIILRVENTYKKSNLILFPDSLKKQQFKTLSYLIQL